MKRAWADRIEERLRRLEGEKRKPPQDYSPRAALEDERTRRAVDRAARRRVTTFLGEAAGAAAAAVATHEADAAGAHAASAISFTPTGGLAADDVQEAIAELDTEKAAVSHEHGAGDITSGVISNDRFSAYGDLVAETKIGTGAAQVAAGDHNHDAAYEPIMTAQAWTLSNDTTQRTLDVSTLTNDAPSVTLLGNLLVTLLRDFNANRRPDF